MAEVVREAVSEYLERKTSETRFAVLDETFGAVPEWKDVDSVEHVRSLRSDWDDRECGSWEGRRRMNRTEALWEVRWEIGGASISNRYLHSS